MPVAISAFVFLLRYFTILSLAVRPSLVSESLFCFFLFFLRHAELVSASPLLLLYFYSFNKSLEGNVSIKR